MAVGRLRDCRADVLRQLRRHTFVGIDFENPVAVAKFDAAIPPCALDLPCARLDPGAMGPRDLFGRVVTSVENDHNLVGEAQRVEAIGELGLFVVRHHERRQTRRMFLDGHSRSSPTRRHKLADAPTTVSTDRLSISVSVVR